MDLVFPILFDVFAKQVFTIEMVLFLRERDARRVDRGSCRDHSEYETPINHELVPLWKVAGRQQPRRISCKRCDQVSFVICAEPMMTGTTTNKLKIGLSDILGYALNQTGKKDVVWFALNDSG